MVERYLKATGLGPGHPWCAAFTSYVGKKTLGEHWPVVMSAACRHIGEWAHKKGAMRDEPMAGDLYLVYYAKPGFNRFAHIGIVTEVLADGRIRTIEGNTNSDGSREGWRVCRKVRTPKDADAFVRWSRLVPAKRPSGFEPGKGKV
jgi:hypothetical protein